MRNLSDFQINSTTQGSMSDGISADIDEQSLSNSQPSLDDEGIDELSALSNGKNDQITVKVCYLFCILNNKFILLKKSEIYLKLTLNILYVVIHL
jgi:hypothetical protein